jgi:trimeric autotransporter adhesin
MRHIRFWVCFLLLLNSGITAVCQQSAANAANATVPQLVKFGGILTDDSGKPLTGTVGVTFLLYKDEQGGSPLWLETQNVQPSKSGHYTVMLGSTTSQGLPPEIFVSGEARWLAVQPQGQPEYPRVLLVSVPYALKAVDAQTIGGLPPSAFVLASPPAASSNAGESTPSNLAASSASAAPPPTSSNVTTTGGTASTISMFTTATNIQNSILTQAGTTAINVLGRLNLPALGTATVDAGFNSRPLDFVASVFNSTTGTRVAQTFQWQAEALNNDKSTATGTLNLLYATGTATPAETGLKISNKGLFTFASGQTFPGTGTVTSVAAGAGLTGGTITKTGTISIPNAGVTNTMLAHSSLTINPGTDLTGGGPVSLGGTTTLNVDTSKIPQLAGDNIFTGTANSFDGNVGATNFLAAGEVAGTNANFVTSSSSITPGVFSNIGGGPILSALTTGSSQLVQISGNDPSGAALFVNATVASTQIQGILAFGGDGGTSAAASPALNGGGGNNSGGGNGGQGVIGNGGSGLNGGTGGAFSGGIGFGGNGGAGGTFSGGKPVDGLSYGDGVDATNVGGGLVDITGAYAGNFTGDINVSGAVFAGTKDFKIDHPLDPANKYLFHASVESSEMKTIYDGMVTLDGSGTAVVELPGWFEAVNDDFRYQLTAIGAASPGLYIAQKISANQFTIAGGTPGAEVSWQVTGVRHDPYAKANPLVVEQAKPARERGSYIHPELYGAPEEKGVEWVRNPDWMKQIKEMRAKQLAGARASAQHSARPPQN